MCSPNLSSCTDSASRKREVGGREEVCYLIPFTPHPLTYPSPSHLPLTPHPLTPHPLTPQASQEQQLDCALDLMRRLPPQQIEKNLSDLIDLVSQSCTQTHACLYCIHRHYSAVFQLVPTHLHRVYLE